MLFFFFLSYVPIEVVFIFVSALISTGGKIIFLHPCAGNLELLNSLFDWNLESENWSSTSGTKIDTSVYEETQWMLDAFVNGPNSLQKDTNVCNLKTSSIPSTAQMIYGDEKSSAVTVLGKYNIIIIFFCQFIEVFSDTRKCKTN